MHRRRLAYLPAVFPLLLSLCLAAQVITVDHGPNAAAQQSRPYVVMVSLDGFRYDYARKDGAKHLLALGADGAIAPEGMIPSYPSLTFPNHYTLVTGLYPEHHGIVANSFYDPARKQRYSYTDPATNRDGSWYGGTPLWVLAEKQGMRTACFFWPGSEAEIDGGRPSYYLKFDNRFPDEKRIDQVVAWLRLPPEQRPHFITLYYSTVDHAGHQYGPDSPETAAAVQHVDELMGVLWADLTRLQLPIDLIVVSDHGMEREQGPWIDLSRYADLENFTTVGSLLYPNSEAAAEKAYQELKIKSDAFTVYRRKRVPAAMHYSSNAREGDPVIVANGPYAIRAHVDVQDLPPEVGVHGYDPRTIKSMRAFFLAVGPDIRPGTKLEPFENVNIYPLVANILGLNAPKVDGNLNVLSKILKDQPADTGEP
ncbi:MAG TPA: ectonucleotide pyrophosphatase/phosphodiesterase [Acidobacteriaceae bacterium]|nr:ectonucleotide pyrophosphatase/phosphodiesterase [Acidobacteriaceae bacterium]